MFDEERMCGERTDKIYKEYEEADNLETRDIYQEMKSGEECGIGIEEKISNRKKERKRKKRKRKIGCIFICIPVLIVLIFIIIFAVTYNSLSKWDKEKEMLPIPAAYMGNELNPIEDELVFLLLGVDEKVDDSPQRTDTIMIFDIKFSTGKIQAISIPRDTYCYIGEDKDKINHAYAYGNLELTIETVRDLLGIDLDYYMVVDYDAVKAVIDAGGGVKYDIPEDNLPMDWETFKTGEHVLYGEEALSFLRHRKSYLDGDIGRVKKQENFLKSAAYQILSPKNIFRYPAILSAVKENIQTNIPAAPFMWRLFEITKLDYANIEWNILPGDGEYIDAISYYVLNADGTIELINRVFSDIVEKKPKLIDFAEVTTDDENLDNENLNDDNQSGENINDENISSENTSDENLDNENLNDEALSNENN